MNERMNTIQADLAALAADLNAQARHSDQLDPLREVDYTLRVDVADEHQLKASLVIDTHSGGSPESDYAIQDEVRITLSADGSLSVVMTREMLETEALHETLDVPGKWEPVLARIRSFCRRSGGMG